MNSELEKALTAHSITPEDLVAASSHGSTIRRERKHRIRLIVLSLCMAQFLSALDTTIVATALPTIARHLNASASAYAWIGSGYTLASTSSTLVWSQICDIWGRKITVLLANAIFMGGSLIAGLSISPGMLVFARVLQGIGGGGLQILVTIIIGDLFPLRERAKYYGFSAIVWAVASGLGPVLGGVFTQTIGWRWCFYINLPLDGLSFILLLLFLKIESPQIPMRKALAGFDWTGCIMVVGGTICFLYGLESGAGQTHSWNSPFTLCLLIAGIVLLILFLAYERTFAAKYAAHPIVPVRTFSRRSNLASLGVGFIHSFVFISYDYFLPLYFQVVLRFKPIISGLTLFALVVPLSIMASATGIFIKKTGRYVETMWFGLTLMTIGTGLFMTFDSHAVWWKIIVFQMITGVGGGTVFLSPLIALQAQLKPDETSGGSSAFQFLRSIGTSVSIVVGTVILQSRLDSTSLTESKHVSHGSQSMTTTATDFKSTYTSALKDMWILYMSFCAFAILMSFFIAKKEKGLEKKPESTDNPEQELKIAEGPNPGNRVEA